MGDYFEGFVQEESRNLGLTLDDIRAWQPVQRAARRTRGVKTPSGSKRAKFSEKNESPE
jgi:hypothetical protein